jgi:hypothetical protein
VKVPGFQSEKGIDLPSDLKVLNSYLILVKTNLNLDVPDGFEAPLHVSTLSSEDCG